MQTTPTTITCPKCGATIEPDDNGIGTCGCGALFRSVHLQLGNSPNPSEGIKSYTLPEGPTLALNTNKPSQRYMADHFEYGLRYEGETVDAITSVLKPGDTFFDVGAHCGYFSVIASSLVGPTGLVVAFEPSEDNRTDYRRNRPDNTILIPAAVTSHPGEVEFHLCEDNEGGHALWNPGANVANPKAAKRPHVVKVPAVTLDQFARYEPTAIKIDTEGAEVAVLRGAHEVLRQPQLKLVVVEANLFGLDQMGVTLGEMVDELNWAGFETKDSVDGVAVNNLHFYR